MAVDIVLTPVQQSFLAANIPGFGDGAWNVTLAGQAGSQRLFYRISHPCALHRSCILVVWDGADEDWPRFLAIPEELGSSIDVFPRIYCSDRHHGLILEEDLGSETLKAFCDRASNRREDVHGVYENVLTLLVKWQRLDCRRSPTVASRVLDYETFLWESDYCARRFVADFCRAERLLTPAWERERTALAREAASLPTCLIHRDFQSENIILTAGGIKFVDFQGARLGPPGYDVASLLYDPYVAAVGGECADRLFEYYRALPGCVGTDRRAFDLCAAQRLMQALGAYGNLSINQAKPRYRAFVPAALKRLCAVLQRLPEYAAVSETAERCRDLVTAALRDTA